MTPKTSSSYSADCADAYLLSRSSEDSGHRLMTLNAGAGDSFRLRTAGPASLRLLS